MRCGWTVLLAALAVVVSGCHDAPPQAEPVPKAVQYQPLWPFASQQDADRWVLQDSANGHSPWHLDPAETAVNFTRNFLAFTEIDRATEVTAENGEAWVGVGYALPGAPPGSPDKTVATIHLIKFGSGSDAPWEVVGSRGNALTVNTPDDGASVGSVIDVGGTITGVDESIRVQARQIWTPRALGEHCCVPGGGQQQPWAAQVTVSGAQPGGLTLVASTGGHVANVEAFAVTGVRID